VFWRGGRSDCRRFVNILSAVATIPYLLSYWSVARSSTVLQRLSARVSADTLRRSVGRIIGSKDTTIHCRMGQTVVPVRRRASP